MTCLFLKKIIEYGGGKMAKTRKRRTSNVWTVEEAKARFTELVSEVEHGSGYQTISKNGRPVAVILSKEDFEKTHTRENTLLEFFRASPLPEIDL